MAVVHVQSLERPEGVAECGAVENPCPTIQMGIDKAAASDTVLVKPSWNGLPYAKATINKSLTLKAKPGVEIQASRSPGIAVVDAPRVEIEGFRITKSSPGISASNVEKLIVSKVVASGNYSHGLSFVGEIDGEVESHVNIKHSRFDGNAGDGISLDSHATASLTKVKTSGNERYGIYLHDTKDVKLMDVESTENHDGVRIEQNESYDGGDILIAGGNFDNNDRNGIRARHVPKGLISITGGSFSENEQDGARFSDVKDVRIQKLGEERSLFESNRDDGLSVSNGGNILIDGGQYKLNRDNGIVLRDVKRVHIEDVLSTQNRIGATIDDTECQALIRISNFLGNTHENVPEETYTDPIQSTSASEAVCAPIRPTSYVIREDQVLNGRAIASDIDGDDLTIVVSRGPANGHLGSWNRDDGSFVYRPNANYHGSDSFEYLASDGQSSSTGRVLITIVPVNDLPDAVDDNEVVDEDTKLPGDVSDNDTDHDGPDCLTYEVTKQPQNGTLTFNADGTYVYTPNPDFNGNDHFEYRMSDGQESDTARVNIRVNPVNDPPVCGPERRQSGGGDSCRAGDANFDGVFNSLDLVALFIAGRYEQDEPATFAQGDFNNDGRFDSSDLIAALTEGWYQE